ncbi:hypothetical protein HZS_7092 [Henneguya salminicola]|nr:hypothetical protein HZS_7092 [Henneguya salminicola]
MASSLDQITNQELIKLKRYIEYDDLEHIVITARKIKIDSKCEFLGNMCESIALIKQEKYNSVIENIKNTKFEIEMEDILMYCHYMIENYDKIISKYSVLLNLNSFQKNVLFQSLFQIGLYDKAISLTSNEFNKFSCEAALNLWGENKNRMPLSELNAEQEESDDWVQNLYNMSCYLLGIYQYKEALAILTKIRNHVESNIHDFKEMSEKIQLNYNYCIFKGGLSQNEKNSNISYKVLSDRMRAIYANNYLATEKNISWFDQKKKLRLIDQCLSCIKFPHHQLKILLFNEFLIYYNSNKVDECQNIKTKYENLFSEPTDIYSILMHFYVQYRNKSLTEPLQLILEKQILNEKSSTSLLIYMTLFEIHKQKENYSICLSLLKTITQNYDFPILIAFTFNFIKEKFSMQDALEYLKNSVEQQINKNIIHTSLLYILTILFTRCKDFKSGNFYINKLKSIHESEPRILALIKLYDYIDISSSSSYLGLSPSDINIDNEKVNQIEISLSFYRLSSKKKEFNPSINKNDTKPKKKKRNPKLPTNYDPLILPNPERWLPKYERTGYKPKKKDKIKKGSHQGATNTVNKYFFSN